jgi:hypothetical protein
MAHRETMLELLASGSHVRVTLDARDPLVNVPPHLRKSAELVLEYGYDMPVPIPDLHVGEAGIAATLSFNRQPVPTFVPWTAVISLKASPAVPAQPQLRCSLCSRPNQEVPKLVRGEAGCVCTDCAVQVIAMMAATSPEQPLSYWFQRLSEETERMQNEEEG